MIKLIEKGILGGLAGADGLADVLTGKVSPSGKLSDTIAYNVGDYPSDANFGDPNIAIYEEDIYVGYRYFETAAKEKVMFPFGFGLSYTSFDIKLLEFSISEDNNPIASFRISVTNTGKYTGKEVVQVYVNQPQGKLGKPEKVLVGFAQTKELIMIESETITINVR